MSLPFFRSCILILFLAFTAAVRAETSTFMQGLNGYAGTSDAIIESFTPDANHGSHQSLQIKNPDKRSLVIRFDAILGSGTGQVPAGATIQSATLSLYKHTGPNGQFTASRLLRPWDESQVTWNAAATGTPWQTPGAFNTATDVSGTPDGGASIGDALTDACANPVLPEPASCWLHIDVTSSVQAFAQQPTLNHGWKVVYVPGSGSSDSMGKDFTSSEHPQYPTLRPKLTIAWTKEFASLLDPAPNGEAIPTFHSMSLYMDLDTAPPGNRVFVRYRKATENPDAAGFAWKEGYPLWYDARTSTTQCSDNCGLPYTSGTMGVQRARGSVVHLQPGTNYVFELATGDDYASANWASGWRLVGTTWAQSEQERKAWPETLAQDGEAIAIPNASGCPAAGPCVITQGGSAATGYKVYDGCQTYQGSVCTLKSEINRGGADQEVPGAENDSRSHAIVIDANYVVVRNVRAAGAAISGIYIKPGRTNVVIEDSEIRDWAHRPGIDPGGDAVHNENPNPWSDTNPNDGIDEKWGWNHGAGVYLGGNNSKIVIHRNLITAPAKGSFPWDAEGGSLSAPTVAGCRRGSPGIPEIKPENHPHGPVGIHVHHGGNQNVIRYNEITGDPANNRKWLLDGIGGGHNFDTLGSPGADSDIYQNIVMNVFDDAIEAEGGGRNVRIWGNYTSGVKTAIATAVVHFGPLYAWRNVFNRARTCYEVTEDDDWFSPAFKVAGRKNRNGISYGDGIRYLFNNTLLQAPGAAFKRGQGRGLSADGNGFASARWTYMRNNTLQVRFTGTSGQGRSVETMFDPFGALPVTADLAFDIFNGRYNELPEPPGFRFTDGQLSYLDEPNLYSIAPAGNYQLADTSFGRRMGTHLPNFTKDVDDLASARAAGFEAVSGVCVNPSDTGCPDVGAHQHGATQSMKFGISAGP